VRKAGETDSNAAAPSKQRGAAARRKPTTAPPDESQNLYVKNLPPDFSAAKLANLFLQHGDVLSTKFVAAEPTAGRPAPTGLVRFATRAEAEAAMAQLNGVKLGGDGVGPATEPLEVSVAMSKEQREAQYAERKAAREERMEKRKRVAREAGGVGAEDEGARCAPRRLCEPRVHPRERRAEGFRRGVHGEDF
jgi:RNA recognition motif-containing protein